MVGRLASPSLLYGQWSVSGRALISRNLTTGAITKLMNFSKLNCPMEPLASPDGTKVVYVNTIGDGSCGDKVGSSVVVFDVATQSNTIVAQVFDDSTWADLPNWSPDGNTILFTLIHYTAQGDFIGSELYTVPAAGGVEPTNVGGAGSSAFHGVYSPDGGTIAFGANDNTSLSLMDPDGTNVRVLAGTDHSTQYGPSYPMWSPDGQHLSYAYWRTIPGVTPATGGLGLAVVDATGANDHVLASASKARQMAWETSWSSDSSEIFYDTLALDAKGGGVGFTEVDATDISGARNTRVVTSTTDLVYSPSYVGPSTPAPDASTYTAIAPTRVQAKTNLGTGGSIDVQVAGGTSPVPAGASAVTLNLTGVSPTAATYLQAFPSPASGTAFPLGSSINLTPGQTAAVAVQVTVAASGKVRIRNYAGTTGVIVDVSGYFMAGTTGNGYFPLATPERHFDGTITGGTAQAVTVTGPNAPAGATAVVLNLTGVLPGSSSYESAFPTPVAPTVSGQAGGTPTPAPAFSNLNLAAGETRANLVTVPIGANGQVSIYNYKGAIHTLVDVQGYYAPGANGLAYYPLTPTRVLDTRNGTNTSLGAVQPIKAGGVFDLPLFGTTSSTGGSVTMPSSAGVAVFNLTAVAPTSSTYLTAYAKPADSSRPLASNLNPGKGATASNLVISKLGGSTGAVRLFNANGNTPVLADLAGYYASPTP